MAEGRLDRIAALTDLLSALSGRQRGEPIQAEQWNTLVDVLRGVLEIDRAQETGLAASLVDAYAPIDHQHLGQVSLAWVDSDLQDRMVTGGAGSVSARDKLTDLAARIGDLSGTVSALSTQLEGVQKRADDSSVDELARSSKLRAFETRFNGVEDLRGLVTSVSAQVQDLSPQVDRVLELRSELTDAAGAPIDVRDLAARVDGLDKGLSAATGGVDGATLRMRDLQVAITELQDVAGVGGGLDAKLAEFGGQLQQTVSAQLDDRLASQQQDLAGQLDQRFGTVEATVDTRLDARLPGVADQVSQQVAGQVAQQVIAQATGPVTDAVLAKVTDQIGSLVDARLSDMVDKITGEVLDKASDKITSIVLDKVSGDLANLVDERIKEANAELTKAVRTLAERVTRLEKKVFG